MLTDSAEIPDRPVTVLLVEDVASDAELARLRLQEESVELRFEVIQAGRLSEAIELLTNAGADMVLLDLGLPDSQGLDTLEEVLAVTPAPVIVLTGQTDDELGIVAVKLGAQDYLPKNMADGPLLARAVRYALERSERMEALRQEVAARQEAEVQLRESEERFRAFTDAASDYFAIWDENLCMTFASSLVRNVNPISAEKPLGRHRADITRRVPEDEEKFQELLRKCEAREPYRDVEFGIYDQEGNVRQLRCSGVPVFGAGGEFKGYYSVATDITEHRKLEDQLRQSQKLETIGQLTGGVAHDFNNLLMVIAGNLELLAEQRSGDGRQARYIQLALDAARRGGQLTNRLLAFSRRQMLDPEVAAPDRLISGVLPMLRRTLGEAVEIVVDVADDLGRTRVDVVQFENALLNLAVNARDAMPDGGRLTIQAENVEINAADTARIPDLAPGDYVRISVSDTGTGIPKEVLDRVFEPFFTTKEVGKGSGLGLSMVFGFMAQSRGGVSISREEGGGGTTVNLHFPRSYGEESAADDLELENDVPGGTETILLVEDDSKVRQTLTTMLGRLGYDVITAEDGPSGLQVASTRDDVDLLISDVIMPNGVNGRQLADAVKALRPGIKVLLTSGYSWETTAHDGVLADGIGYLPKPYEKGTLARKVREILDGQAT